MVNFVEILFGIAIGAAVAGVVFYFRAKRDRMKAAFITAGIVLALAVMGEAFLRMR